jgi:hypothetical protein
VRYTSERNILYLILNSYSMQVQNFSLLQYYTLQRVTVISDAIPFTIAYCVMEKHIFIVFLYYLYIIYFIFICCL